MLSSPLQAREQIIAVSIKCTILSNNYLNNNLNVLYIAHVLTAICRIISLQLASLNALSVVICHFHCLKVPACQKRNKSLCLNHLREEDCASEQIKFPAKKDLFIQPKQPATDNHLSHILRRNMHTDARRQAQRAPESCAHERAALHKLAFTWMWNP